LTAVSLGYMEQVSDSLRMTTATIMIPQV
jgi:hypothetical protein